MKPFPNLMNTILTGVLLIVILTLGLPRMNVQAALLTPVPEESVVSCSSSRTVQVSGTAVINVEPDRVLIQLGIQSNGSSAEDVQRRNASTITRVRDAIKRLGVSASDISSENYIIEPIYEDYDDLYIKGYRIYNIVAITLREVDRVNEVLVSAFEAGANQVVNVEFYISNLRTYRDQARDMAMQAAAEKASALAHAVGAETGCVLSISENSWSYYSGYWYGNSQSLWTQNVVQNIPTMGEDGEMPDAGPVSPGHISVQAQVYVTFGLNE